MYAVVMLHGEQDSVCPPFAARKALEQMSSPDRTWVLLTKAKHNLELDVCQKEWESTVLEWLGRQSASGTAAAAVAAGASPTAELVPVQEVRI